MWFHQCAVPQLQRKEKPVRAKFEEGALVTISYIKNKFTCEYNERWTGELFRVTAVSTMNRIPMYKLKDYSGEEVSGLFYAQELQRAVIDEGELYKIEKILKTRKRGSEKQHFVLWKYWPPKYAS